MFYRDNLRHMLYSSIDALDVGKKYFCAPISKAVPRYCLKNSVSLKCLCQDAAVKMIQSSFSKGHSILDLLLYLVEIHLPWRQGAEGVERRALVHRRILPYCNIVTTNLIPRGLQRVDHRVQFHYFLFYFCTLKASHYWPCAKQRVVRTSIHLEAIVRFFAGPRGRSPHICFNLWSSNATWFDFVLEHSWMKPPLFRSHRGDVGTGWFLGWSDH